jgi:hypothetical protein
MNFTLRVTFGRIDSPVDPAFFCASKTQTGGSKNGAGVAEYGE